MAPSTNAELHTVFPVERRGDTLIVTPRGSASGFGIREMESELKTVLAILDGPEIKNVIVDLQAAEYFGSQMIGAINSMILPVRDA
ncbi:MAG: hypothetical protein IID45_14400, partial [Planctomycetes bacterium]|nr:hypothetical protein [Planctomycetota bacterium]